ncbi:MAG: MFS transporter [Anaerolineae bacterium]|nr:MFS transporter [Anaerolineae bacterium]
MASPSLAVSAATYRNRYYAWAFYDWANSAVVTLVIAAVFPVFFNQVIAKDTPDAASLFAYIGAAALLLSIIAAPVIGTLGDITGQRKRLLIATTTGGSLAVCALFTTQMGTIAWAALLFILIQISLNMSFTLYDSLLSHVAREDDRDRLSTTGYALGYIGGGLHLLVCVILGLASSELATRAALLSAGVWWFVFALPLFIAVPEPPASHIKGESVDPFSATFKRLKDTLQHISRYRQLLLMLAAFWLYSDGIGTIIGLSTTYGSQQLRLNSTTLVGALLLTQFVAFPYALMFGRIASPSSRYRDLFVAFILWTVITFPIMGFFIARNEFGGVMEQLATLGSGEYLSYSPVQTLTLVAINQVVGLLLCWFIGRRLVTGIAAALTTKRAILLGIGVYIVIAVWAFLINTPGEFWLLAWLVATVQGGTQALSRSLFSTMTPASKSGEFFGFYSLTDKFGSIFGLLLFGLIGQITQNLRISILSVIVFFVAGGLMLMRVDEKKGHLAAVADEVAS